MSLHEQMKLFEEAHGYVLETLSITSTGVQFVPWFP